MKAPFVQGVRRSQAGPTAAHTTASVLVRQRPWSVERCRSSTSTFHAPTARRRLEETDGSTEYPQLPWYRIVTICATVLDPRSGSFEVRALGADAFDERSHLEGFFGLVSGKEDAPRLVS
jgi:hypothetical protein